MEKVKIGLINNILKNEHNILVAYLFGSESKDKANKYSDIDIAILFDANAAKADYTQKMGSAENGVRTILMKNKSDPIYHL